MIGSFFEWVVKPFVSQDEIQEFPSNNTTETEQITTIFRPSTFSEYIGQYKAKRLLETYMLGVIKRNIVFPHVLIHSSPGMGKTTLARLLSKELKVNFIETIASEIKDVAKLLDLIYKVKDGILFLDEIHAMPREIAEKLYPMMEDFQFDGNNIPYFTLIGATTELGEIIKNRKPFMQRFKIPIELEKYTIEDLIIIAKQYKNSMFPRDELAEDKYRTIAQNCRYTPRIAITLLESTIYFDGDIGDVLDVFGIVKDGYTTKDIKLLKYILSNKTGVGLDGLASYLDTSVANYKYEIEPYLLQNGLIIRTPRGRKISEQGIQLLREIGDIDV